MKKNMGSIDRAIRILAALVIGILLLTEQIEGVVAVVVGVLAIVFLATSVMGFCPLYMPFKISTRKEISSQEK